MKHLFTKIFIFATLFFAASGCYQKPDCSCCSSCECYKNKSCECLNCKCKVDLTENSK